MIREKEEITDFAFVRVSSKDRIQQFSLSIESDAQAKMRFNLFSFPKISSLVIQSLFSRRLQQP